MPEQGEAICSALAVISWQDGGRDKRRRVTGSKAGPDEVGFSADGVSWNMLKLGGGNFQVHEGN